MVGSVFDSQKQYFKKLLKLCEEYKLNNLIFIGPKSDVRALLKRFDIYVCCSLAESSPISVWEAMSMAKPIVSTNVGDVPEYILEGVSGFIVDVDDSKRLSERIEKLISNPHTRMTIGKAAREIAMKNLDIRKCAKSNFEIFKKLVL